VKIAILYAAHTAITPMHRILQPTKQERSLLRPVDGQPLFIRMEIVESDDPSDALAKATPMYSEIVLNSVEL